jgi:hypothetical protein
LWQIEMDARQPSERMIALNHLAFDVPNKRGWGCYFKDPDGNGLEIYCDTREAVGGDILWRDQDRPIMRELILAVQDGLLTHGATDDVRFWHVSAEPAPAGEVRFWGSS